MGNKIFTEKQTSISAAMGGPISAGILIYKNYKQLGKDAEATKSIIITFLFTFLLFYGMMQIPEAILNKIPDMVFTVMYGLIVYIFFKYNMAEDINEALNNGAVKASNWMVAGLTLAGLIVNVVIIFAFAYTQPVFPGQKLEFGQTSNEVYFDQNHFSTQDVNLLASTLSDFGFFTNEYQTSVYLERDDSRNIVTLSIDREFWEDPEVLSFLHELKISLMTSYSKEITLKLEHYDLSGKVTFKEL